MFQQPPITLWIHAGCAQSEQARGLVERARCSLTLFEPLVTPPRAEQLRQVLDRLNQPPKALVRPGEPLAAGLGVAQLVADRADDDLIELLTQYPALIERPIAVSERGAVICRPAALVLRLCMPRSPSMAESNAMIRMIMQGKDVGS